MTKEILGIDIGGVIIKRVSRTEDTSFHGNNYMRTPAIPGMFEALRRLVNERFGTQVYLVSKASQRTEEKTLEWFAQYCFFEHTGVLPDHVRFCRERRDKAPICAELGVTHFVDDRFQIMGYLMGVVPHLYLFRPYHETYHEDVRRFSHLLPHVRQVNSPEELVAELLKPVTSEAHS